MARASADNALGTATKAAVTNKTHIVYGVSAGFTNAAVGKLLTIKDGATIVFSTFVHSAAAITFPRGLAMTQGAACSAELAASGTAGQLGDVCLHGVTV